FLFFKVPDIGPLDDNDSRVLPQLPRKLAVTDVDAINFYRPVLEQAVGKTSCGCADIHCNLTGRRYIKILERSFKFEAATADIGDFPAAYLHKSVESNHGACFCNRRPAHEYLAFHDQCPRPLAT